MKIRVERSGGFAGIGTHAEVDTAKMAPEEAREWESLVAAADLRSLSGARGGSGHRGRRHPGMPDAFHYDVTVEHDGARTRISAGESELPQPARELVHRVVQHGRA